MAHRQDLFYQHRGPDLSLRVARSLGVLYDLNEGVPGRSKDLRYTVSVDLRCTVCEEIPLLGGPLEVVG